MFQAILRVIILTNIAILRFTNNFYSELALSFLPYIIGICFVGMIVSFINLRKYLKNFSFLSPLRPEGIQLGWAKGGRGDLPRNMRGLLLISFGILFLIQSNTFNNFYNYKSPTNNKQSAIDSTNTATRDPHTANLNIFYANIHKNNTDYEGIQKAIETANPDLILFVEFSENHYKHLKAFLQKNYPYINSTTRSKKFIGSMVFSKYKIENWADDFPQGSRRYAFFSIQLSGQAQQYFYLVHTSSPDSYAHFEMRNKQLTSFTNDFQSHQEGYRAENDKVLILGDFNVSPRSAYYKDLETQLGSGFVNATRLLPIAFTREFAQLPLFWAHIDHVWTNDITSIENIKTVKMPGSDHKGITFEIAN